jgi:hypothetical protein
MPIEKVFLDWDEPALPRVVDYLVERYRGGPLVDLSSCLIVVPGSRAGRRLNELLLRRVDSAAWSLFPPHIVTIGQLPELLYDAKFPFASQMVQDLAWAKAVREAPRDQLRHVMTNIPDRETDPRWMELGILLRNQHRELAGDGLDFADALEAAQRLDGFHESDRWQALVGIQSAYLRILDNLNLWDRQTARLVALERKECRTDRDILLVATADMNRVMRDMLDQVEDRVTSLIFAPSRLADHFDSHGCIRPETWRDVLIDLKCEQIEQVDSLAEQAAVVPRAIASLEGRYSCDEITVGVPDETLVPHIEVALRRAGIGARWGPGHPLEASRPLRLLRCMVDYLRGRDFTNLAEIVRHPDVGEWLATQQIDTGELLDQLDEFQNEHLPTSLDALIMPDNPAPLEVDVVTRAMRAVEDWLRPLGGKPRHPDEWSKPLQDALNHVLGDRTVDQTDHAGAMLVSACDAIRGALQQIGQVPDDLIAAVTSEQAILMVLQEIGSRRVPAPADDDSIELVGWLDLFLDDAPAAIVTSFNEGFIPSSIDADLFLPNKLRSELEIDDSERLLARDVYATSALAASRRDLHIVLSRRRGNGDPVSPSRLLFAADHDTMLRRSLRFFGERPDRSMSDWTIPADILPEHRFQVPAPRRLDRPLTVLRVTDFRSYLACPYRFYLRHVLQLRERNDDPTELDAAAFGAIMHAVLDQFGASDRKDATDASTIAELLDELLDGQARQRFGSRARAAVRVQIEQLRLRLQRFAEVQAARRTDGWRILVTEGEVGDLHTNFIVDDQPIVLKGRIDRVDFHEPTNTIAILDYKSADGGEPPEKTHRQSGAWIDLQLPLYRHLAKELPRIHELGPDPRIELGYVLLPRELGKVAVALADWSNDDLSQADDVARQVVRDIRYQRFWPPRYPAPAFAEEFASICQDAVFDRHLAGSPEGIST